MPEDNQNNNQNPQNEVGGLKNSYPQPNQSDQEASMPPRFGMEPPNSQNNKSVGHPQDKRNQSFNEFGGGGSAFPSVLVWITFILVAVATGFFWMSDYSNVKAITAKEEEKNSITSQLESADNKKVEAEATNFKIAFGRLSNLVTDQVSKADFLTGLYAHFTRDITITGLTLSSEGDLSINGATGSYRQVADFMLGIKGYDRLSDIALKNVSISTEESVPANRLIVFSISAKANMEKEDASAAAAAAEATTGTDSTSTNTPPINESGAGTEAP